MSSDFAHSFFDESHSQKTAVSVLIPVFGNEDTLIELHQKLSQVLNNCLMSWEVLFVNDASPDDSLRILREITQKDSRVAVVSLEKNIGQHRAVMVGLEYAKGEIIVILDADLQDPPEAIPLLLEKMKEGYSAVFAGRRGRYESNSRLLTSRLFKKLLHLLLGVPADAGFFLAMDRRMAHRLLDFHEPRPFVIAMMGFTRLPMTSIPVWRSVRPRGESAYSFWKRLQSGGRAFAFIASQRWGIRIRSTSSYSKKISGESYIGARFVEPRKVP